MARAKKKGAQAVQDALTIARKDAIEVSTGAGIERVQDVMRDAAASLEERLSSILSTSRGADTFTTARLRATLDQVHAVLTGEVLPGMRQAVLDEGERAASMAGRVTHGYLQAAHAAYEGTLAEPLPVREAFMVDKATQGARASILRRLATSGTPDGVEAAKPAKFGILQRYGIETLGHFEGVMQQGILTRSPIDAIREKLVGQSPFLQAAPRFWAERIARTEIVGAFSRATFQAGQAADEELGDLVKILAATFDDRIGSDSVAVHGQIRRMEEPFESWFGPYMAPPNRPNDREIIVMHRISWPLPDYLTPKGPDEIAARWEQEKRKGAPPPQPLLSTVDRSLFGRVAPPQTSQNAPEE